MRTNYSTPWVYCIRGLEDHIHDLVNNWNAMVSIGTDFLPHSSPPTGPTDSSTAVLILIVMLTMALGFKELRLNG